MIKRIAGRKDCGNCYRPFKPFETVHYLGIDNNSFCAACREKIAPGAKDDPKDYGGWVPSLHIGNGEDGRENIMKLITLWNDKLENFERELRIEVDRRFIR